MLLRVPELVKAFALPTADKASVHAFPMEFASPTGSEYRTADGYYLPELRVHYRGSWRLEIVFNGPDARYEPAVAVITESSLDGLLDSLKHARDLALRKASETLEGEYVETIASGLAGGNVTVGVQVATGDGRVVVTIGGKRWAFWHTLTIVDAGSWIDELVTAGEAGARMAKHFETDE